MSSGETEQQDGPEPAHWFAVSTAPRHEKRVADRIREKDLDVFLAVYAAERNWIKRRPTQIELPLFPGYVFVQIAHSRRGAVLSTPGVKSIVGNRRQPLSVPAAEIETLRRGLALSRAEPHPYLETGTEVVIVRGPFAGLRGILIQKRGQSRVVIAIQTIMKAISAEVAISEVVPVSSLQGSADAAMAHDSVMT